MYSVITTAPHIAGLRRHAEPYGRTADSQWLTTLQPFAKPATIKYQLRQLREVVQSLTSEAAKSLINAFISNRLDYCNSLLYGITDTQLQRLQWVQNAAAMLVDDAASISRRS